MILTFSRPKQPHSDTDIFRMQATTRWYWHFQDPSYHTVIMTFSECKLLHGDTDIFKTQATTQWYWHFQDPSNHTVIMTFSEDKLTLSDTNRHFQNTSCHPHSDFMWILESYYNCRFIICMGTKLVCFWLFIYSWFIRVPFSFWLQIFFFLRY